MTARAGTLLVLLAVSSGCVPATTTPLTPLVVDWPSYFALQWQAESAAGRSVIRGTIQNTSPYRIRRIQLLIEGLDAGGTVVNQRVEWLGTDLAPSDRVAFESPVSGPAATYRVIPFAFDAIRPT
jgi:hypothetical protein